MRYYLLIRAMKLKGVRFLSKVSKFIKIEFVELCEWDVEISKLNPILDPLTIIINIIIRDDIDINNKDEDKKK